MNEELASEGTRAEQTAWPHPSIGAIRAQGARAALAAERVGARVDVWRATLAATFFLAFIVRGRHVLLAGSPVNDGGMFATMSADIQRAGYALPAFTSYNGADIPFAYPPFALYLAALIEDLSAL